MKSSIRKQRDHYTWANRLAADLVLRNIERHGGPNAGLVRWAQLFRERDLREQQGADLRIDWSGARVEGRS